ncbi:MAG: TlpA family protein disulfide reductase [Spirochaetaceae bacterium]|jgi:thiol-disulfide isomerase/thioredoxin|nr:TlpA family protein disulfide reductase [Spirochaetaceae bacterium]
MKFIDKQKAKWKKKKRLDKITDILFYLFIVALLLPGSRNAIIIEVKRLTAFSPNEIRAEQRQTIEESEFYWEMETLTGVSVNLIDYTGKTIFLNEWATWCPPCIAEMPSIQKLYDQLNDDENVVFLMVTNEKKSVVEEFINKNFYTFPVLLSRSNTPEAFYSPSIPTTFLVSPEGEIVLKEVGSKKWHGDNTVQLIRSF